jgi:predicted Zn-dependent protease
MLQIVNALFYEFSYQDGDYAMQLADKAINLDKKNAYYLVAKGDAYRLKDKGGEGLSTYEQAKALDPKLPYPREKRAEFLAKLNPDHPEGAETELQDLIKMDPAYPPAYKNLALIYSKSGKNDDAVANYKKFLQLAGSNPVEEISYGYFLVVVKKYDEAIAVLTKTDKEVPNNPNVQRYLAYAQYEAGRPAEARQAMEKMFSLKPEKIDASDYLYYAKILSGVGQDSLAVQNYEKVIALDTNSYVLYDSIAKIYSRDKKYELAANALQSKIEAGTHQKRFVDPADYFNMALDYFQGKNYIKADTVFNKVTGKFYPTWPTGFYYQAKTKGVIDSSGTTGAALPVWDKFVSLTLNDSAIKAKGGKPTAYDSATLAEAFRYKAFFYYAKYTKVKGVDNCKAAIENFKKVMIYDPADKSEKQYLDYLLKVCK